MTDIEFREWPKIARLNREIVVTEKIDGTNAAVIVQHTTGDGAKAIAREVTDDNIGQHLTMLRDGGFARVVVAAQSRKRLIAPGKTTDNYGFAGWVRAHAQELADGLGVGYHYGEWWGGGIQCGYGLEGSDKRFSLFNTERYGDERPACCGIVPTLYRGPFSEGAIKECLHLLRTNGSQAAPGFMQPEGIIVYHTAARTAFKVTLEGDESPKGART